MLSTLTMFRRRLQGQGIALCNGRGVSWHARCAPSFARGFNPKSGKTKPYKSKVPRISTHTHTPCRFYNILNTHQLLTCLEGKRGQIRLHGVFGGKKEGFKCQPKNLELRIQPGLCLPSTANVKKQRLRCSFSAARTTCEQSRAAPRSEGIERRSRCPVDRLCWYSPLAPNAETPPLSSLQPREKTTAKNSKWKRGTFWFAPF